jgi:hypothetical protein
MLQSWYIKCNRNRISGEMDSVRASSMVDRGFESRSNKRLLNWYLLFSNNHAALRTNSKDWLSRNQENVSEWGNISIRELMFQ